MNLFLAAVNTYLKEYLILVTCLHVSDIRTESCDQPEGSKRFGFFSGVRLLTESLRQGLTLHSERLEVLSLFPKHSPCGRKHKSTLRKVSGRAAKQKSTNTEQKSSRFHLSVWQ